MISSESAVAVVVPSATEEKRIRLHVGGLAGKVNEKDVEERFRSFGKVEKVDLIPHPFEENMCRGFAYVNLITTDAQLSRCMNSLNGCAWKGGKLHISHAKPNRFERLEDGRIVVLKPVGEEDGKKRRRGSIVKTKRQLVRHASDQSLVTDKNVDKRKGWRRGRYGRAITCLRIRRPNRQMLIIDPSHYKNSLEKLFGSIKPKPLRHLTWTVTDIKYEETKVEDYEMDTLEVLLSGNDDNEDESVSVSVNEVFEDAIENSIAEEQDQVVESVLNGEMDIETDFLGAYSTEIIEPLSVDPVVESVSLSEPPLAVAEVIIEEHREVPAPDTETVTVLEVPDLVVPQASAESDTGSILEPPTIEAESGTTLETAAAPQTNFEVNVNWSSLFAPQVTDASSSTAGFSLNSLLSQSSAKIKDVSVDELFKKQPEVAVPITTSLPSSLAAVKKVHNYAHLFADLNRITPTTATRFGMHLSQKDDMMQEWRVERIELKEDFKKKLADGKRRNRRNTKMNGIK